MLTDARQLNPDSIVEADLCIVGAGAAGITLARQFSGGALQVCLAESGSFDLELGTQDLYRGKSVGMHYWPLEASRVRFFGGTTNHWGGGCIPLNAYEFSMRDWVAHSGWPITQDDLLSYYRQAMPLFGLKGFDFDPAHWESGKNTLLPFEGDRFTSGMLQHSPGPVRFGLDYRDEIVASDNVRLLLNANILDIGTDANARTVTGVSGSTLEGRRFTIRARTYVLAMGGIETARLMLLSDGVNPDGLANDHHLIGRYFADQPYYSNLGFLVLTDPAVSARMYAPRQTREDEIFSVFLTPTERTCRDRKLLSTRIHLRQADWSNYSTGVKLLNGLWDDVREGEVPDNLMRKLYITAKDLDDVIGAGYGAASDARVYKLGAWVEPMPRAESRVYLGDQRDHFGQRRIVLDWRLGEEEQRSLVESLEILGTELGKAGLGRVRVDAGAAYNWSVNEPGLHHMGTTRMHDDPKQGVVNRDCKVHGLSNLYVASSSVFPTYGYANPTLTIAALALRLSDHLRRTLS